MPLNTTRENIMTVLHANNMLEAPRLMKRESAYARDKNKR